MENTEWLRPKTTRRYLHPPKAELLYTLWAEGKITLSEITWDNYIRLDCSGLWLAHGADDAQMDFRTAENRLPADGIPFHGLTWHLGGLEVSLDAFCEIARRPVCFAVLHFTNTGERTVQEPFALYLRTGREHDLVFHSPDVYTSYAPDIAVWKNSLSTWHCTAEGDRTLLRDEHAFLSAEGIDSAWDAQAGALRFPVCLAPGESASLTLSFGKSEMEPAGGKALPFDIRQEKAKARSFWKRELDRIDRLPEAIRNDPERLRMVQNLTVQLLQCFCHPVGRDYMIARQGGLQRRIWPWEAAFGLEALGRIGEFTDYIEPVLEMYFDVLQAPDGEIRPAGIGWANITASVLYSFARYCLDNSLRFYHRFRDAAMAAFDWIKRTRASSASIEGCFAGLFPPRRANDWAQEFQAWMATDTVNLRGLLLLADAAERFGDPRAEEIRAEAEDYRSVLRQVLDRFDDACGHGDTLRIPLCPDGNDAQLIADFYPYFGFGRFLSLEIVRDEDVDRVYRYARENGICRGGLYGHMPRPGTMHIWYTTNPELYWFLTWMRLGRRDLALEIIDSQIRYSMTDEYYMQERYDDHDPWFAPWSPNFSANGRMIIMLLDYYGG